MNEPIINQYADTLFSCLIPYDMHFEHRMPTHSIIYVRSGKLVIEEGETTTEVEAGNYVFVKRDCTVNVTKVSLGEIPYRGINLTLRRDTLKEYYSRISKGCLPKNVRPIGRIATILPKNIPMESLFQSLTIYVDSNMAPTEEVLQLKLQEAIECLLSIDRSFYPILFDFNEAWKIDILDFMEHNFTEDMTLEEFASYTGRSLATFKRDFAKISDVPPQRWITEHRLELAKQILTQEGISATDACFRVGFKNRSHFSTAFKRRFGYAPSFV
jgi:putative uncharacterized protein (fragment)